MSNPPYGGMPPAQAPWSQQVPPPARQPSRLPLILTAALAVIAIIVGIASWFRPAPEPEAQSAEQQFSEQEVAEAKEAMCAAWDTVYEAIFNTAKKTSPDDTLTFALGIENELAFHAAGDYLMSELSRNPAYPEKSASSFRELARTYHEVVLAQLADAPEPQIEAIKDRMGSAERGVRDGCDV